MKAQLVNARWYACLAALGATLALAATAGAQQIGITGKTVDATSNVPIPAAQVIVTGTTVGTNTTDSGTFTLRVPADARTIAVRRIGYLAQTVTLTPGKTQYTIALQPDVLRLEAQVVTGVATTVSTQNAANAVAVVNAQQVNQVPTPTVENSLEGKVPGANIEENAGGAPGGGMQVQIRGITSIYGNAEPLYVLDGVILNNQTIDSDENAINRSGGSTTASGTASAGAPSIEDNDPNRIADLNPDDIESIEVLKGASAAAIYGSLASAGVIVITTKRGTSGKAKWDINGQVGQYTIENEYPLRSFPTLASAEAWYNTDYRPPSSAATRAANDATVASLYSPINYQNELFGNSQAAYETDVSVSGTQGGTQYFLSGLSKYDNGTMLNTGYNKQSLRTNVTQQFAQALSVTVGANYIHDLTRRGITGNDNIGISPYDVFSYTPQFMNLNQVSPSGAWPLNPFGNANPFADAVEIQTPQEVSRFIGSGALNWTPWKTEHQSLQVNANGGADLTSERILLYAPPTLQVEQDVPTGLPGTSVSNDATVDYYDYTLNLIHHYTGISWLDATTSAGFLRERKSYENPISVGYATLAGVNAPTAGSINNIFYEASAEKDQSVYAQEQIMTLASRLTLTGGVTGEKSTENGDIEKFFWYPRYSGSYRIPQFVGFLNDLKLRVAYGQSGNLGNFGTKYTPYTPAIIDQTSAVELPATLGQPNLTPENEQETELGFDATMLNSRAQFSFTVYQKRLTSLLLQAGVAPSYGYSALWENGGEFTNQGIELQLTSTPVQLRNGFNWVNTLSFARNYSVVNNLPGNVQPFIPLNTNFGFGEDLIQPGRSISEIANTNIIEANGIAQQVGDFSPGELISMSNEFTWHHVRVYGLVDWSRGGNTINLTDLYFDSEGLQLGTDSVAAANRLALLAAGDEPYVETATFFKVREVSLSYDLPERFVTQFGFGRLTSARLSLNGYNLWSIFNYHGLDPEVSAFGNEAVGRGYDVTPYPPVRSVYVGLDLGL